MRSIFSRFKKLPQVPDKAQRIRLLSEKGRWLAGYRAVSYPVTDEAGEGAVRVATEAEFWASYFEHRFPEGELWPISRVKVPKHYQRWVQRRSRADAQKSHDQS